MYVSVRRYQTKGPKEVLQHVQESFVPLISKTKGFISYEVFDAGGGVVTSISHFETKAEIDESDHMAHDWVAKTIAHLIEGAPEITEGDVAIHKGK